MSAKIESVGTEVPSGAPLVKRNAINLSVRAARKSLKRAGIEPSMIGVLINSSVYKDENIGEPAVAAFIQRDLGANPMPKGSATTFSFDIIDGGCGLITGMEIIDGLISCGEIEHGIVITSDVNPSSRYTIGFKFRNSAAALVLGRSDSRSGFVRFQQYEFLEHFDERRSNVAFQKDPRRNFIGVRRMRNILTIEEAKEFRTSAIERSVGSIGLFLEEAGLDIADVDLVIPSQYPVGLPQEIEKRTGIGQGKVAILPVNYGVLYSSGPGFALRWAMKEGLWERSENVLFLGVSPGLKVSLGLYRNTS
ncbi:MAG: 3-oxoacyl-[acyl-carrier-protein] synthase III C-terminal domain-containing protein [Thermoplasmatota archaeon]